jgi:Transposase
MGITPGRSTRPRPAGVEGKLYFDDRVTNSFAEGITKIKVLKRRSYGFRDPFRYRQKVLLSCRCRPGRHG